MKYRSATLVYVIGFGLCLGSAALFDHLKGNHGSTLAWSLFALSEFLRHKLGFSWERPEGVLKLSTLLACAVIASIFPATFILLKAHRKYLRIAGYLALALVLYSALLWFQTPWNLF